MFSENKERTIKIIYDGECPVCNAYVRHMRLKQNYGTVELVNARENIDVAQHYKDKGMSLDDGMIVQFDNSEFYGPDAVHAMALLSSSSGIFNRVNSLIFSHARVSKFLYPAMKTGRAALLKLLGRSKINNSLSDST